MFNFFKRRAVPVTAPLRPEADAFLKDAVAELAPKQAALDAEWGFKDYSQWTYDQESLRFRLERASGESIRARGQVLGSYSKVDRNWEWAWNNPHVAPKAARSSKLVRTVGRQLGISYLCAGHVPIPGEEFLTYLCAIGVKACKAQGIFRGAAGSIDVMILIDGLQRGDGA